MIVAKQSTARTVIVGPILDADGVAVTDAAVGDLKISKNGAAPAALNGSATLTHRNTGHYSLALTTSDTDTVGSAEVVIDDTTNAMPVKSITIVEEAIYDALFAASATGELQVDAVKVGGQAASATGTVDFDDVATIEAVTTAIGATGSGLSAVPWNSSWDAEVQSECADALTAYNAVATTDLPANFADLTIAVTTGLVSLSPDQSGVTIGTVNTAAALGAQAKLDVNAECDTSLSDYDAPTKAELDSGFAALNDLSAAEVNAEVDTALADIHLDHLLATAYDATSKPGAADALLNEMVQDDSGVTQFTANALEQGPGGGGGVNVTQINGTSIAGTGSQVAAGFEYFFNVASPAKTINDCGVAGSGLSAEDVWTYSTRVLTANTNLNDPTAAAIADAVWDEATSGHTTAGTFGKASIDTLADTNELQTDDIPALIAALNDLSQADAQTACDNAISNANVVTTGNLPANFADLTITATTGLVSLAADQSGVTIGTVTTNTDMRGTDSAATAAALATVDANVDSILEDTGTTIPATLSSLATAAALATAQADLDTITGSDGVTLATTQGNYAPAKAGDAMALTSSERSTVAGVIHTTAMTESYGTDGSALTLAQACYLILGGVSEFAIAGTTKTVKQLDGSTTAATYTLDDADNPTSITRSS